MSKLAVSPRAAAFVLATGLLALPSVSRAQAYRVFASARNGNDANDCANIATPCQTLQAAVTQVAAGGTVLVLDSGGYGPMTITKAVTVDVPTGIEAFIHPPSGNAITIQAGGSDVVVLRGLTLSIGALNMMGVEVVTASAVHVERCVIQGFYDGVLASRAGGPPVFVDLFVDDTIIRDSAFNGIGVTSFSGTLRATVDHSHIVRNGHGGVHSYDNARTVVWKSLAAGNDVGFLLLGQNFHSSFMVIERSAAENNKTAGIQADGNIFDSPANLWLSDSTLVGNGKGIDQLNTSQLLSRTNNTVEGNATDVSGTPGTYLAK